MGRVPEFKSREEEAEWWDTHSITDYLDEMEPVEVEVRVPLEHTLSVRMESTDFRALSALARSRGVGITTMARMILREALRRCAPQKAAEAGAAPQRVIIPRERLEALPDIVAQAVEALIREAAPAPAAVSEKPARYRAPARKTTGAARTKRGPKAGG